ncbi:hypothetical protein ACOMHN_022199 [Nucella lapillus]
MTPSRQTATPYQNHTKRNIAEMKYFTRRWVLAYLLCVVRICQTALRQCIGMALVCMTTKQDTPGVIVTAENSTIITKSNSTILNESAVVNKPLTQEGEFLWSRDLEGHILGAYYYGFLLTVMMAGYVDRCLGSVRTIAVGIAGGGVVNLLTPVLTRQHPYLLVALRVLAGCANQNAEG